MLASPDDIGDEDRWQQQTLDLSQRVTAWTGNDIRILEVSANEVRDGLLHGDGALLAIRDEGRVLCGAPRALHRLVRDPREIRP